VEVFHWNFQRALHESTYIIHHVIPENASVSDVQHPAVLGHLVGVRLMNVWGLHLRPGAHSSYLRAAPGAPLPRYRYHAAAAPASSVNYGPSDSERQHRPFIFFMYEKKIKTASERLFFLGKKSIKPKTQFQKHEQPEVVLHWITRVFQLFFVI
jgi:hypothetical protein